MKREEMDKRLDEWLDQAVTEYGRAKTRPGFEARILANVNSRLVVRKWRFRWLTIAATAAAVLVFSFWVFLTKFQDEPARDIASHEVENLKPAPERSTHSESALEVKSVGSIKMRSRIQGSSKQIGIKPSIGPGLLSSPPSEEERLLIAYARSASRESRADYSDEFVLQPLEIPETVISPLEIPELKISSTQIEPLEITMNESEEQS
jgi:hypothetical protein